ncbi:hypothetical protein DCS_06796 [Drechmeria coniospora]|uniref:Vps41 beta-propeller domain-containing protein n=1 Tax=Drechmeria coniospora TaxID=98403 RepID=A0A151GCQ5_DRECN|nr:hypothetical protein DCS_06796 [Drechmeria coniospora]KYK54835.1 hypothetical protein DCS_06796 [Drechmeria coniospora]
MEQHRDGDDQHGKARTQDARPGRQPTDDSVADDNVERDENVDDDADDNDHDDADADDDEEEEEEEEEEGEDDDEEDDDEEEEEEEEEEPLLKYAQLTQHLRAVYRNGDATSAFLVAGDKMHVVQLPTFQTLRMYHAHSASVTSISISPYPPPLPTEKADSLRPPTYPQPRPDSRQSDAPSSPAATSRKSREPMPLPKIPSNDIYVATSSMDGNVCIQSIADMKDVQLRNFARPVQAVALSPDYKVDRTYLSGGLAGQLIMTVGGGSGRSTSTTTGTAAATASGWLGSVGLGGNSGKDTVLHSGEGSVSCIKWSLSGKYVAWLNEHGIKIMRSKLHLESVDSDHAWKRMGHIDRPQTDEWETMAGVWKGRVEWVDEKAIGNDETLAVGAKVGEKAIERLLVGWGSSIWIIHIHPGGLGTGKNVGERTLGRAEIVKILRMDCIISGISLYTQNLLIVLAFVHSPDDEDADNDDDGQAKSAKGHKLALSSASTGSGPSGGIRRKQTNQPPELRLIDLDSQAEVDKDTLSMSRYERLSSGDYHLSVLPGRGAASAIASKGALEALAGFGTDMWNVAINPKSLFNSAASVRSRDSGEDVGSGPRSVSTVGIGRPAQGTPTAHPSLAKPGAKIFLHSPYDCILGTKRDLADHLAWLVEHEQYQQAWELLDENPDILAEKAADAAAPSTPSKRRTGTDDFYDDESVAGSSQRNRLSPTELEKRRVGELWIQELIEAGDWASAGEICGKVLATPDRWEKWVWTFAGANKFQEITYSIPDKPMNPPLPSTIYEVILGHYIQGDKPRFRELLERWPTELFDVITVSTTLENQLKYRDVREDSIDDGEKGRDWRIVVESLAKLHEAGGRNREALKCYIKLHDADAAFRLIREGHLAEAVADDIPGFIQLRVSPERADAMSEQELAEATAEAITVLVDEAQHGLVRPDVVVEQLRRRQLNLYLYFYLKGLWRGEGTEEHMGENRDRLVMDSQSLVDDFADLAVHLFATYDRALLIDFLKTSTSYTFEKAVQECETARYDDELVYLYSKTGQMKRALYLIIDRLRDVQKAIEYAKEQEDPDLWGDLIDYSMDKPNFIRALLEQVGTSINPITLVRRIPEGLEIQGLREGLTHMMKEHELQHSLSSGVARVLRSELAAAQNELRAGQRRGVKFEVVLTAQAKGANGGTDATRGDWTNEMPEDDGRIRIPPPGHCVACHELLTEHETETLMGFACGHVFHVSHLLEMLHKGKKVDAGLGGEFEEKSRYLVGMKVMRARLLKDKVQGGCPICREQVTT